MLFIRPRSLKNNRGYILVGALALAVIVAVAASMAILSSQQKVDEERNKEANINARLAMDSQASRILTLIDRGMEIKWNLRIRQCPEAFRWVMLHRVHIRCPPCRSSIQVFSWALTPCITNRCCSNL